MSRYAFDDSGPFDHRVQRVQPPFTCSKCGNKIRRYNSAAWNAGLCDRCQPATEDPEFQRLLRADAVDRALNQKGVA